MSTTVLSYKQISDILQGDASLDEFTKMWGNVTSFLKYADGIPSMLEGMAYFDDEFIVENRLFLADIFALAESLGDSIHNTLLSGKERDVIFNRAFEDTFFEGLEEETVKVLRAVFDVPEMV